jgi:hypothetical protein
VKVISIGLAFLGMRGCHYEEVAESGNLACPKAPTSDEVGSKREMRSRLCLGSRDTLLYDVKVYSNVENGRDV